MCRGQVGMNTVRSALGLVVWAGSGFRMKVGRSRGHLVVGDLQQVQHDLVGIHVLEQPLLLLPHLLPDAAHLVQPLQDLGGAV